MLSYVKPILKTARTEYVHEHCVDCLGQYSWQYQET